MPRPDRLAFLIGATLLPRAGFAAWILLWARSPSGFHTFDTASYLLPARELARTFAFAIDGVPDIYRTPGYSLCLVPGILLGHVELWAVSLNLVLAAGTAAVLHRMADRLFADARISLAAPLLYAFDPLSVFHTCQVSSETAFTFLLVVSLEALLRHLSPSGTGRLGGLVLPAVLVAAAAFVRPAGMYLPYALAAFLAFYPRPGAGQWEGRALRLRLGRAAVFLGLSVAPILAWQARNAWVAGYPGFSAAAAVNAHYHAAAAVRARLEGVSIQEMRKALGYEQELYLTERPRERIGDQAAHFRAIHREARRWLASHPLLHAQIHIAGMFRVVTNPGASGYLLLYHRDHDMEALAGIYPEGGLFQGVSDFRRFRPAFLWWNLALGLVLGLYYLAALRGMVLAFSRRAQRAEVFLLLTVACYFVAASGGAFAVSRFRHPVMPMLCLFAGAGLVHALSRLRSALG